MAMPGAYSRWRATGVVPGAPVPRLGELLAPRGHAEPRALGCALDAQPRPGRPLGAERLGRGQAEARHVDEAVWLQRCIAATAPASAAARALVDDAPAVTAQRGVPVTVPRVAAMQMRYQVPTLAIDAASIARGYVDVRAGTRFSVATTSREGYVVDLVPRLALFRSVEVTFGTLRAALGADGGTLIARGRPRCDGDAELTYRFRLAEGVAPGVYPFPLDLAVRPL